MKIEEIKTIVKMMSDNDLTEFKIEAEEYNLCIKRGNDKTQVFTSAPMVAAPVAAPVARVVGSRAAAHPRDICRCNARKMCTRPS